MAVVDLSDLFSPGVDILGTSLNSQGTILCQTGDVVGGEVASDGAEWWQHVGFASLPALAIPGKSAAQTITINQGSNDIAIASRDVRGNTIYGNLGAGETCLYAGGAHGTAQGKVLIKGDGSVTLSTTDDNTHDGAGVYLRVAPDMLAFHAPWGRLIFDAAGLHIETQNGGYFDLCNTQYLGLPGSSCTVAASTVTIDAPMVFLGPSSVATSGVPTGGGYAAATYNPVLVPGPPLPSILCSAPGTPLLGLLTSPAVFVASGIPG